MEFPAAALAAFGSASLPAGQKEGQDRGLDSEDGRQCEMFSTHANLDYNNAVCCDPPPASLLERSISIFSFTQGPGEDRLEQLLSPVSSHEMLPILSHWSLLEYNVVLTKVAE